MRLKDYRRISAKGHCSELRVSVLQNKKHKGKLKLLKDFPKKNFTENSTNFLVSFITVVLISLLLINEIIQFLSFEVESGVKIDHKRDSGEVRIKKLNVLKKKNALSLQTKKSP